MSIVKMSTLKLSILILSKVIFIVLILVLKLLIYVGVLYLKFGWMVLIAVFDAFPDRSYYWRHRRRRYWLSLIMIPFSSSVHASDFNSKIGKLNQQQNALEQKLSDMGVTPKLDFGTALADDSDKKRPLYVIHSLNGSLQIPQGEMLFGRVVNRLIVGPEGSPAIIELNESQGRFSGLRLLGKAIQGSTTERLNIEFQRLRFRGGNTIAIQGTVLDQAGAFGLKAEVISQKALAVMGALASSFISGFSAAQQTNQQNAFGFEATQRTGRNAILQGVSQTAADQSKHLIDEATAERPVLIVEPDTKVTVLFNEEVRF